jgi:hypothetical protein
VVWCGVDRSGNYACYFAESVGSEEVGYVIMTLYGDVLRLFSPSLMQ